MNEGFEIYCAECGCVVRLPGDTKIHRLGSCPVCSVDCWTRRTIAAKPIVGRSSAEVCAMCGVTYRQLDYWTRKGLVSPSLARGTGSGTQRIWSDADIQLVMTIKAMLDEGFTLESTKARIA